MARGDQLSRQWKLLQLLISSKKGKYVSELADLLGCHHRTVYRDLEALQTAGFPLYDEKKEGKSKWLIMESFSSNLPIPFSLTELMALYFSRDLLSVFKDTIFHDSYISLIKKVKSLLPQDSIAYLEQIEKTIHVGPIPYSQVKTPKGLLSDLHNAVRERRYVEINYFAMSTKNLTKRLVAPYSIWLFNGGFYLIGDCCLRKDIRVFAVDRIRNLDLTDRYFELDEDLDVGKIMRQSFGVFRDSSIDVKIRFSARVAGYIEEKVWHPSQKIDALESGEILFHANVAGLEEIKNWILQWGADATVIEPQVLKNKIKAVLMGMADNYNCSISLG